MDNLFQSTLTFTQSIHLSILLLLSYVIIQVISHRKTNLRSNGILLFLLFQFFTVILVSTLMDFNFVQLAKYLIFLFIPPLAFIAPTCYLYINSLTNYNFYLNKTIARHFFIPILIFLIGLIINIAFVAFYHSKFNEAFNFFRKAILYFMYASMYGIIFPQLIFYSILSFISYKKHLKEIQSFFSNLEEVRLQWLKFFIIGFSLFVVFYIIGNSEFFFNKVISDIIYYSIIILFIVFIGLFGAKQVDIYSRFSSDNDFEKEFSLDLIEIDEITNSDISEIKDNTEDIPEKKQSESFFSNEGKQEELKNLLLKLIEEKKLYKKDSLTIEDLSFALHTNKKYLSHIINEFFDKNFYNFINEYRIKEAILLLSDPKSQFYSIEGIGNLVGFKSKSSFYSAFKKVTGKTPYDYKQTM